MQVRSKNRTLRQRITSDLSPPIWCLAGLYFTYFLFQIFHDSSDHVAADATYALGSWLIISWWLWHDAKQNNFVLPMSYGFLILVAAPLFWPIYLFETRGRWGFLTLLLYGLILMAIMMLGFLASLIRS